MSQLSPEASEFAQPEEHGREYIDAHSLFVRFREENLTLGVSPEIQERVDQLLWLLGEVDERTADHSRRVGDYAGAVVDAVDPEHNIAFIGLARVSGGLHDIGKRFTDPLVLRKSWGEGEWNDALDRPRIRPHASDGFSVLDLADNDVLPDEAKFISGCHHRLQEDAYGVDMSVMQRLFGHNEAAYERAGLLLTSVVAADVFDSAYTRLNDGFCKDGNTEQYLTGKMQDLFPENWYVVLSALDANRTSRMLRPESEAA